jgi:hypothetical protein
MQLIAGPWVDNLRSREDLLMSDLVWPAFRESRDEAIFVMFGQLHTSIRKTLKCEFRVIRDNY